MALEAPLVHRARELARVAHAGHERKGGGAYFEHLEAVAHILAEAGYEDEERLAAAYLHDLLEDRPTYEAELREQMPEPVVAICEVLTETKLDGTGQLRDKRQRFEDYLGQLRGGTEAAEKAIAVSCADKIHNVRSLVEDEAAGRPLLLRLNTRPGEHRAQLAALRDIYAPVVNAELLRHFDVARVALFDLIARWLPGRAVMIAAEAHLGQLDKAGAPYVDHPLRLRSQLEDETSRMVAVLHDVVEDSDWTLEQLRREGFGSEVLDALDHLTKRADESYEDFIGRVAENDLAAKVKRLDLEDNLDPSRIPEPTAADEARRQKYRDALDRLSAG